MQKPECIGNLKRSCSDCAYYLECLQLTQEKDLREGQEASWITAFKGYRKERSR